MVTQGRLAELDCVEVAVYLFLCIVADRHGVSWYGAATLSRWIKHPPDAIRRALLGLARRNLVSIAGRFVQVLDLWRVVPPQALQPSVPARGSDTAKPLASADVAPASERLARLPASEREVLLTRARRELGALFGGREPSQGVLMAVAAGLVGKEELPHVGRDR
jgi:hypothetical protein